tara:strand:+ start:56 stop:352 length:297 start_codon:yes stop_codon:yes gene_type:complete
LVDLSIEEAKIRDFLFCPIIENIHQPIARIGVETSNTEKNQTNIIPSDKGHAQMDVAKITIINNNLDPSLGVSHPLWSLIGANKKSDISLIITPLLTN